MPLYGIPQKVINLLKATYGDMECGDMLESKLTDTFEIKPVVKRDFVCRL